jgi:DUF438 domain-containing protein
MGGGFWPDTTRREKMNADWREFVQQRHTAEGAAMMDTVPMAAILDSLKNPILFADTAHITRYMNKAAIAHYKEGQSLIGRSLLECHNEESQAMMIEILAAMHGGEDERLITDNEKHRIFMRAVRDEKDRVLGYYERYEPPARARTLEPPAEKLE